MGSVTKMPEREISLTPVQEMKAAWQQLFKPVTLTDVEEALQAAREHRLKATYVHGVAPQDVIENVKAYGYECENSTNINDHPVFRIWGWAE